MNDVDAGSRRKEIFRPLLLRWPQVFGRCVWVDEENIEVVDYLADRTSGVDERILVAFVRFRIATDTPYRNPPGFFAKFFQANTFRSTIADLQDLQRRFEAMKLVAGDGADESAMILPIVAAAEPGKIPGMS